MLSVEHVSFGYAPASASAKASADRKAGALKDSSKGSLILDDVSLEIPRGSAVAILGPNGSGKTTLLRLLTGSRKPLAGDVRLEGRSLAQLSRRDIAQRLALVPQETHLAFEYTVLEMVLMGRHPHLALFEMEGPDDMAVAREALSATGTAHLEMRRFSTLSGGEKQRVVIAAALAQASEVLLLDEPTASLDLGYQLEIASLVRRLNKERAVTIVMSTHDLQLAASICDRAVLLRDGRVLAAGAIGSILTPAHVRDLFNVETDIYTHQATGRLVVVPVTRVAGSAVN